MTDPVDDDDTVVVRRGRDAGAPAPRAGMAEPDDDLEETTAASRRRSTNVDPVDLDDGSTLVVRRESKRRAEAASAPKVVTAELETTISGRIAATDHGAAALSAPGERVASSPEAPREIYRPRAPEPVVATRTPVAPPPARGPGDTVAVEEADRRTGRRRMLIVVGAASLVVIGALTSLALIALLP